MASRPSIIHNLKLKFSSAGAKLKVTSLERVEYDWNTEFQNTYVDEGTLSVGLARGMQKIICQFANSAMCQFADSVISKIRSLIENTTS